MYCTIVDNYDRSKLRFEMGRVEEKIKSGRILNIDSHWIVLKVTAHSRRRTGSKAAHYLDELIFSERKAR